MGVLTLLLFAAALKSSITDQKILRPLMQSTDPAQIIKGEEELAAHEKKDFLFTALSAFLSLGGLAYLLLINRKLERALEEEQTARERLLFFDELTEETLLVHDQGIIVDVNRAIIRLLGYERSEMVGHSLAEFMDPPSAQQTHVRLEKGYPEGSYEIGARAKDGTVYPILVHGWDFTYQGRKVRASSGWDLRKWKEAEAELEESRERFERFVEVTREGILIHQKGTVLDANPRLLEMTGADIRDMVGGDGFQFLDEISAEKVRGFLEKGYPEGAYELNIRRKDGTLVPVEVRGRSFSYGGEDLRVSSFWDITERKKAAEAIRHSEERFRNLLENASDSITLASADGKALYVSPSNKKIIGFEDDERMGRDLLEVIHPDDRDRARETLDWARKNPGETRKVQLRAQHKDGRWLDVEYSVTNLLANPTVRGILINGRDITQMNRTLEALKKSEENSRNLIEKSPDAVIIHDQERIRYVNPAFLKIAGYADAVDVVGKGLDTIVPPEEWKRVQERLQNLKRIGDVNPPAERAVLHKDGSRMAIEAVSFTTLYEGRQMVAVVMRDLSEKMEAEQEIRKVQERFRRVYEDSPIGIALVHLDSRIISANPKLNQILGYQAGELEGKSFGEITHPEDLNADMSQFHRLFSGEIQNYTMEKRYHHKKGHVVWGHLTVTMIRDPSGRPLYALGMMEDITQSKKTQETLMKFERLSTIGEMAAGIAHEIRNPLASISAAAQILKRREKEKDSQGFLDTILEQTRRLDQLVQDTLSFARTERATDPKTISLKNTMEAALRLCQVQFGPTHSKVRVEWDAPVDLQVTVNLPRIQQVLVNLILNAYQVMPEGGVLSLSILKKEDWAVVRVADTGPGVKPEDLDRIFEPFFTTKTSGSGLGLAISQKIAEEHGGKIEMEKLEPRGTAFSLRIPTGAKGPK